MDFEMEGGLLIEELARCSSFDDLKGVEEMHLKIMKKWREACKAEDKSIELFWQGIWVSAQSQLTALQYKTFFLRDHRYLEDSPRFVRWAFLVLMNKKRAMSKKRPLNHPLIKNGMLNFLSVKNIVSDQGKVNSSYYHMFYELERNINCHLSGDTLKSDKIDPRELRHCTLKHDCPVRKYALKYGFPNKRA